MTGTWPQHNLEDNMKTERNITWNSWFSSNHAGCWSMQVGKTGMEYREMPVTWHAWLQNRIVHTLLKMQSNMIACPWLNFEAWLIQINTYKIPMTLDKIWIPSFSGIVHCFEFIMWGEVRPPKFTLLVPLQKTHLHHKTHGWYGNGCLPMHLICWACWIDLPTSLCFCLRGAMVDKGL